MAAPTLNPAPESKRSEVRTHAALEFITAREHLIEAAKDLDACGDSQVHRLAMAAMAKLDEGLHTLARIEGRES